MSIWVSGDIHGNPVRFSSDNFYEQNEMNNQEENYVIVLGDFGLIWSQEENKNEKYWLKWLEEKNFTTLFIDGNHENHLRLNTYPIKEWHGGKIHEIRPHVLHLMRGEIFNIDGLKFFAFGGASSHDISDGILDISDPNWKQKAKQLDVHGKYMYRIKGLSWWEQEIPTEEEMQNGINNLNKYDNKVDFILSHSPSTTEQILMGGAGLYKSDRLTNYLDDIKSNVEYKRHLFGHMHINKAINDRDICLYEQIVRIN